MRSLGPLVLIFMAGVSSAAAPAADCRAEVSEVEDDSHLEVSITISATCSCGARSDSRPDAVDLEAAASGRPVASGPSGWRARVSGVGHSWRADWLPGDGALRHGTLVFGLAVSKEEAGNEPAERWLQYSSFSASVGECRLGGALARIGLSATDSGAEQQTDETDGTPARPPAGAPPQGLNE